MALEENLSFIDKVDKFLYIYMYQLEVGLQFLNKEIAKLPFQIDEANIDSHINMFIKNYIVSNNLHNIFTTSEYSQLNINDIIYTYNDLKDIHIHKVLIKSEITNDIKENLKSQNKIYTSPDLLFLITDGVNSIYKKIEIKTTKNNQILGSSVKQIDTDSWCIFIKRYKDKCDILTGKYLYAIDGKLRYPDRNPRPTISFNQLKLFNSHNRVIQDNNIIYNWEEKDLVYKESVLKETNDFITSQWLDIVKEENVNKTDFQSIIKLYSLKLLNEYDKMSSDEKNDFKNKL